MNDDPRYADINNIAYPPLTRVEAAKAMAVILHRLGRKSREYPAQTRDAKWRSAPRKVWVAAASTVGIHKGWGRLIHDASHKLFSERRPSSRPHDHGHEAVEREVFLFCQQQGWFDAPLIKPKPKLTTEQKRRARLTRVNELIKRWCAKEKRAVTARKKLHIERRRIEKALTQDATAATIATGYNNGASHGQA